MKKNISSLFWLILIMLITIVWALCPMTCYPEKKFKLARNEARFQAISIAISAYYIKYHILPDNFPLLKKDSLGIRWLEEFDDAWENPFVFNYNDEKEVLTVTSFGKDKIIGGTGFNKDWIYQYNVDNSKIITTILSKPSND